MGSYFILMPLAYICFAIGCNWSGIRRLRLKRLEDAQEIQAATLPVTNRQSGNFKEKSSTQFNIQAVSLYVLYLSCMLVLAYVFLSFFKYLSIFLFAFCGVYTQFRIIYGIFGAMKLHHIFRRNKAASKALLSFNTILALTGPCIWLFTRSNPCSWILHAYLGVCAVSVIMVDFRLPNFRIISFLLIMLFIYDIFFVFGTGYFTKDGVSIMESVARGSIPENLVPTSPSDTEKQNQTYQLTEPTPFAFSVPTYYPGEIKNICLGSGVRILYGFGDVAVPGLLISYLNFFDRYKKTPYMIYYVVSMLFYGIGMVFTDFVIQLTSRAQPALFYLVPATLLPIFILSLIRCEFRELWFGDKQSNTSNLSTETPKSIEETQISNVNN